VVMGQRALPPTLEGLQQARDMIQWRLEASAYELSVVLRERGEQMQFLMRIDEAMREIEGARDGDSEGEASGSGDEDDAEVEEDEEDEENEVIEGI